MNIHGIPQYPNTTPYSAPKGPSATRTGGGFTRAAEKAEKTQAAGGAGQPAELEAFKQEIYGQIGAMPGCASTGFSIQISEGAFARMQSDPAFKEEMLDIIRRDLAGCQPPITSLMINIDENGYSGQSYNFGYGADRLEDHEEDSFYKRPATVVPKAKTGQAQSGEETYSDWLKEQMLLQSDASRQALREALERQEGLDIKV